MVTKPLSALIIVVFGHVNFFTQTYESLSKKVQEINRQTLTKPYWPKEEKVNKKINTSSQKQLFARFKDFKSLNLKKNLELREQKKVEVTSIKKANTRLTPYIAADFNVVKLVMYGCCGDDNLLLS